MEQSLPFNKLELKFLNKASQEEPSTKRVKHPSEQFASTRSSCTRRVLFTSDYKFHFPEHNFSSPKMMVASHEVLPKPRVKRTCNKKLSIQHRRIPPNLLLDKMPRW